MSGKTFIISIFVFLTLHSLVSCDGKVAQEERTINIQKYDIEAIAYIDTLRLGGGELRAIGSYDYNDTTYHFYMKLNNEYIIPRDFPVPIRLSSSNPKRYKIVLEKKVPVDSFMVHYTDPDYQPGIYYIITKR